MNIDKFINHESPITLRLRSEFDNPKWLSNFRDAKKTKPILISEIWSMLQSFVFFSIKESRD